MEQFFEALKRHIEEHPLNFGDSNSVLTMLYECYSENYPYDNEQIRSDFSELYKQMNGMPLQEVDKNETFSKLPPKVWKTPFIERAGEP